MIDFLKLNIREIEPEVLLNHPLLEFKSTVSHRTGELGSKQTAEFHQMKFIVYDTGYILLQGSPHMAYNSLCRNYAPNQTSATDQKRGYNGNSFNYTQLAYVLRYLARTFNFALEHTFIQNIEFGLNLRHTFETKSIVSNLIMHKGKPFLNGKAYFYFAEHSHYTIKCYDKSVQYDLDYPVLRFEVKYIKMERLNQLGVTNIADLLKKDKLAVLGNQLFKRWNEVFLFDYTIRRTELKRADKMRVTRYQSKRFWLCELKAQHRHRDKCRYRAIESRHSDRIKEQFSQLLAECWSEQSKNCVTLDRLSESNRNLVQCVTTDHSVIQSNITQIHTTRTIRTV